MGNLMLCEKTGGKGPSDAVVTWLDGQGEEYCLRPRPQENQAPVPAYNPANGPLIARHFSSAIFEIGSDVLVKVKWAPKGWPKHEGLSMRLVKERAPDVLLPEAIHFWYDEKWDRYFLIQRRIHGPSLDEAWWKLSTRDKRQVSEEIANAIRQLSEITAPRFQDASGGPVADESLVLLDRSRGGPLSDWGPYRGGVPGPFTSSEFREYLLAISNGVEPPEMDAEFCFTHGDLSPGNVILSGTESPRSEDKSHVHVAAIIDWERAAFVPKFWIMLYLVHPLGAHWLSLGEEQYRTNVNLAMQYAAMVSEVLKKELAWPLGEEMFPWLRQFVNGRNEVRSRRHKEEKLAKEAEKLRVE